MAEIRQLLKNNKQWADRVARDDPRYFPSLAEQQNPDYLWIGCSDSRVPANMIVGVAPGEIFVHRNVANLVYHTDTNCLSVIQFAVDVLQVEHIIVCGHYRCGGVTAALEDSRHGLVDNWLRDIQDTAHLYGSVLDAISDRGERINKLCELNVAEQVLNVGETTVVQDAWARRQPLEVHGWIYGLKDGIIRDLEITITGAKGHSDLRDRFIFNEKLADVRRAS